MRIQRYFIIVSVFLAAISILFIIKPTVVPAGSPSISSEIDKTVKQYLEFDGDMNLSGIIAVAKNGKLIYKYENGYADYEKKVFINQRTNFNLASVSKQFTAMAIMVLYEQGKLDVDDKITKYIPELQYEDVTIRHLLTHTGSLPDYMELVLLKWEDKTKPVSNEDIIGLLKDEIKMFSSPGESFNYSNTGYLLLASVVERVSKQAFDKFLEGEIFAPLDMKTTLSYNLVKNQPIPNRAYGYEDNNSYMLQDLIFIDGVVGDGSIYSNLEDLLKWDQALRTEKLVKKATLDMIFTPFILKDGSKSDYGFGWFIEEGNRTKRAYHSGKWVGFRSYISRNLGNDYTILFFSNASDEIPFEVLGKIEEILDEV